MAVKRKRKEEADREIMNVAQFCDYVGISASTFHAMQRRNELPPRRQLGKRYRFIRSEIQAWLRGDVTVFELAKENDDPYE